MKFFLSLLLSLMVSYEAQAQIINFPDPKFKNALVNTKCVDINNSGTATIDADYNNDGEISVSEARLIKYLLLSPQEIQDLKGIEYFINLENLTCNFNKITSLNLVALTNLKILNCSYNQITYLNVQGLNKLYELTFESNQVISINVQGMTKLLTLACTHNQLTDLNIQGLTKLERLYCGNNKLTSLNVQGLNNLRACAEFCV